MWSLRRAIKLPIWALTVRSAPQGEKAKLTCGIVCKREGRRLERLVSIDRGNPR